MTSLFDFPDAGRGAIPIDLVARCGRGVTMLEFFAVEAAEELMHAQDQTDFGVEERSRQTRAMVDAAREEATAEARVEFEELLEERLAVERQRVDRVCAEFARDRQRYFAAAEGQVVKLALAVATRVLQREVEADKMHLTATVRAALARVHDGSSTVLRVHSGELECWSAMFAEEKDGRVEVMADQRLQAGECVLETEVGRVELGVAVQLDEIERGFGGLLHRSGE